MELVVFFATLFFFLFLGVPIALVLVVCAAALMAYLSMWDPMILAQSMLQGTNSFSLMAIPFFIFAGEIMASGGLSRRIIDFSYVLVGRVRGSLGYVAIVSSMLFAGLMGSSVASAAAIGALLIPVMKQAGYEEGRAAGVVAASAIIGPIIPPSGAMILLGSIMGLSVSKLFMIGIVPGILMGVALMSAWFFVVRKDGYTDVKSYTLAESLKIIKESTPAFLMPVLLIGGIRSGVFTPTEAGAFTAVYAILVCKFYYKELNFQTFLDVCSSSAKTTAVVMLIVASATAVGWFITVAQIPTQVANLMSGLIDNPLLLLLVVNLFLFILGMVMDLTPNILIFGPVIFPVIQQAGIDPYFFALLFILNLCIGVITPPVGTVLYVVSGIGDTPFGKVVKGILPFLLVELILLVLFIFFPSIVMAPMEWLG